MLLTYQSTLIGYEFFNIKFIMSLYLSVLGKIIMFHFHLQCEEIGFNSLAVAKFI